MHLEADMINAVSNYEKTKLSMANVFLQYDQDTMIAKFSLKHDPSWLYLSFVKRIYRINRKSGNVQWSEDDFKTVCEADYNEAMTIYDVLCYSKDECHLAHKFVNVGSLSTVQTGNLSSNNGFFQNTADFFNGKIPELRNACLTLDVPLPVVVLNEYVRKHFSMLMELSDSVSLSNAGGRLRIKCTVCGLWEE